MAKFRQGFVSNSSSSSFILRTSLTKEELQEKVKKLIKAWIEYQKVLYPNGYERYLEKYTDADIEENIQYIDTKKDPIDNFLKRWYECEDFDHADIIIYSYDNFIPDIDDFWAYLQYGVGDTSVIDYCGHMG